MITLCEKCFLNNGPICAAEYSNTPTCPCASCGSMEKRHSYPEDPRLVDDSENRSDNMGLNHV